MSNRVALITGAGAGIGAATARLFCQEGAAVTLVDWSAAALDQTLADLRRDLPEARLLGVLADVADPVAAKQAVERCVNNFGGLSTLVSNAAMRNYLPIADATVEQWNAVLQVNLIGAANYARAALGALRRADQPSIVMVSSCYAVTGRKNMGLYDATKAALLALTRTLACEEAEHGVRVNAVCPGSTLTEFHIERGRVAGKDIEQLKTERNSTSLIGRWATPLEIAYPIMWLSSTEASFITGATLMVDGGLSIL